ncbi:MAG: adenylate/guanylate cyclase domain-containing protein [Bacteroidota bacterium]
MSSRRLAAIMFTDIVGYTSMMQRDENKALSNLERYKKALEEITPQFNGDIIQYYGDGCLLLFPSSLEAIEAASKLQLSFGGEDVLPVRIGIHQGDVLEKEGNIFGDAVNVASRVESMGTPGSILFSSNIYQSIKSHPQFVSQSLGVYEFKNVEDGMEVFALANEGMSIPDPNKVQGKFKLQNPPAGNLLQSLWAQKVPQVMLLYLVGVWLIWQAASTLLSRSGISPYWSDIFLWFCVGLLPSIYVYLTNRERINKGILRLQERVLFPSNILVVALALFFVFKGTDLGAMTQEITIEGADGRMVTTKLIKDGFRLRLPIYPFQLNTSDTSLAWTKYGVTTSLFIDLLQDPHIMPENNGLENTTEKLNSLKGSDTRYYIDGEVDSKGDSIGLTPIIRMANNGSLVAKKTIWNDNYYDLIDEATKFIRKELGLIGGNIEEAPDLPFKEITTSNFASLQAALESSTSQGTDLPLLEKAIELDSTFALANFIYAQRLNNYSSGKKEAQLAIMRAMRHRSSLPLQIQIVVLTTKHIIFQEWKKAEKYLNIQREINPNDPLTNSGLMEVYYKQGQFEKAMKLAEAQFEKNPNSQNAFSTIFTAMKSGHPERALEQAQFILDKNPQQINAIYQTGLAHLHLGNYDEAQLAFDKILLIKPESEDHFEFLFEALEFIEEHPNALDSIAGLEGFYRSVNGERIEDIGIVSGQVFVKPDGQNGYFIYPKKKDQLAYGNTNQAVSIDMLRNEAGEVYATNTYLRYTQRDLNYYSYKQDSTIWEAENYLRRGNYLEAKKAYAKAYQKHPEHFYLKSAIDHINYVTSRSPEELTRVFKRLVGEYGEVTIWVQDGLLYYKRPGVTRRIFRPVGNNRFMTMMNYSFLYEFEEEGGKIVGLTGNDYNFDQKKWLKSAKEDYYFGKTQILD